MKYKFKPYSNNIIFFDTEFSGNHKNAELLSIGMVKMNGEELYLELEYEGEMSRWVKTNVLPNLTEEKVSQKEAIKRIKIFIGNDDPYLMSFIISFDYVYLVKLFGFNELNKLFHWPPIDFASILFGNDIDPESYYEKDKNNFFKKIGVDTDRFKHNHNALEDARLLREVYMKMSK